MSMLDWAEKEIEIACKRENPNRKDDEWDYGCACYESALKAFKSLMGDGHSGFSIGMTKHILNRLIDGKPLTPIEDTEDVWNDVTYKNEKEGYREYQCKRMSSLFKTVYSDGTVKYSDVDSYYCININDPNVSYRNGLVGRIIDEMFPITMPYFPGKPMKVVCEELLTDRKNGDFDTIGILYVIKPNAEKISIERYFKESENGWDEITLDEFGERKKMDRERRRQEEQ